MRKSKLTLKANFENGKGSIGNIDEWREHDPLLRADILRDWIYELEQEYSLAVKEMFAKPGEISDEEFAEETPKPLTGVAGEILKHCELIGTKTIFVMYMPPEHEQLLIPSAIQKAEEFLTYNTNGCVELKFDTYASAHPKELQ